MFLVAVVGFSSCVKTEIAPEVTSLRQAQLDKLKADIAAVLANVDNTKARTDNQILLNGLQTIQNDYNSKSNVLTLERQKVTDDYNKALLALQLQNTGANNTHNQAMNATVLAYTQATLESNLAKLEAQLVQALLRIDNEVMLEKDKLEQNKLAYEKSVAAYELFLAEGNFNTNVSAYLTSYGTETGVLTTYYNDRLAKEKEISVAQLMLSGAGYLSWDVLKARLEVQLSEKNAELTAAKAALTALQGVVDNPATLETTKAATVVQISDLVDQRKALDIAVQKAANDVTAATQAVTDATNAIAAMATINGDITTKNAAITAKDVEITTATTDITTKTTAVTTAQAAVVPLANTLSVVTATLNTKISDLAAAQSAYNVKLAAYNTAFATWTTAVNDVAAKTVARDIALNNWNADLTNTALQTIYNNAVTALATANTTLATALTAKNDANTALTNADGVRSTAQTARDNAQIAVTGNANPNTAPTAGSPQGQVNTAQAAVVTAQTALTTAQATLVTKNNQKAALLVDLSLLTTNKANIQAAYDAAVANMATLQATENTAKNAKAKLDADVVKNTAMKTALDLVVTALNGQISNLTGATGVITLQKAAIVTLENSVADLTKQIAQNSFDKTEATAKITVLQSELAVINTKITEQVALVAYWKKLLDDAIAGI